MKLIQNFIALIIVILVILFGLVYQPYANSEVENTSNVDIEEMVVSQVVLANPGMENRLIISESDINGILNDQDSLDEYIESAEVKLKDGKVIIDVLAKKNWFKSKVKIEVLVNDINGEKIEARVDKVKVGLLSVPPTLLKKVLDVAEIENDNKYIDINNLSASIRYDEINIEEYLNIDYIEIKGIYVEESGISIIYKYNDTAKSKEVTAIFTSLKDNLENVLTDDKVVDEIKDASNNNEFNETVMELSKQVLENGIDFVGYNDITKVIAEFNELGSEAKDLIVNFILNHISDKDIDKIKEMLKTQ